MPDFKPISRDAVPLALAKVERYRLLNEPAQAESICLDVLAVDPDNQQALVMLLRCWTTSDWHRIELAPREGFPNSGEKGVCSWFARCYSRVCAVCCFPRARPGMDRLPPARSAPTWRPK